MAYTPKSMYMGTPGLTIATLATVPGGNTWIVNSITLVNTTGYDARITLYTPQSGGVASAANCLVNVTVGANDSVILNFSKVIAQNGTIQGLQITTNAICVHIDGQEVN